MSQETINLKLISTLSAVAKVMAVEANPTNDQNK